MRSMFGYRDQVALGLLFRAERAVARANPAQEKGWIPDPTLYPRKSCRRLYRRTR